MKTKNLIAIIFLFLAGTQMNYGRDSNQPLQVENKSYSVRRAMVTTTDREGKGIVHDLLYFRPAVAERGTRTPTLVVFITDPSVRGISMYQKYVRVSSIERYIYFPRFKSFEAIKFNSDSITHNGSEFSIPYMGMQFSSVLSNLFRRKGTISSSTGPDEAGEVTKAEAIKVFDVKDHELNLYDMDSLAVDGVIESLLARYAPQVQQAASEGTNKLATIGHTRTRVIRSSAREPKKEVHEMTPAELLKRFPSDTDKTLSDMKVFIERAKRKHEEGIKASGK